MDRVYVMQLVRSFQCGHISRREFLSRAALAIGSTAAATALLAACGSSPADPPPVVEELAPTDVPATAPPAPPATDTDPAAPETDVAAGDVLTEDITYPGIDGETLMGYLVRPIAPDPLPAVVVIQEWWGLNEHIREVARRFALQGFVALAPDLYDGVVVTEPDEARKLVMELDMEAAVTEIRQAAAFLLEQGYVRGTQTGAVGFCMGGRLVLQTARNAENIGAGVAFYGSPLTPEEVPDVNVPLLGLYGSEDGGIPVADVRAMEEALAAAGMVHEIQVYDGADHAFFNDTRASYNPEASADAWERTLAWFNTHLSG